MNGLIRCPIAFAATEKAAFACSTGTYYTLHNRKRLLYRFYRLRLKT